MKNCYFEIAPRGSGKTEKLINNMLETLQDPLSEDIFTKKFIFICINNLHKKEIKNRILEKILNNTTYYNNNCIKFKNGKFIELLTVDEWNVNGIINEKTDIFIDEYLKMTNFHIKNLYFDIKNKTNVNNVFIKTTSNKLYNKELFNIVKFCKENNIKPFEFIQHEYYNEIHELIYNFLTDPKTYLISRREEYLSHFTQEQFETEMLGKVFKD